MVLYVYPPYDEGTGTSSPDGEEPREKGKKSDSANSCKYNDEIAENIKEIINNLDAIKKATDTIHDSMASRQSLDELANKVQRVADRISAEVGGFPADAVSEIASTLDEDILPQIKDINDSKATKGDIIGLWNNNEGLTDIYKRVNEAYKQVNEIKNLLDTIDIESCQYRINDSVNDLEAVVSKLQSSASLTLEEYNNSSIKNVNSIKEHLTDEVNGAIKPVKDKITSLSSKLSEIKETVEGISQDTKSLPIPQTKHKAFFAGTVIFVIALVLSAIFITHGWLVVFPNHGLRMAALVLLGVSFVAISAFNLAIDLSTKVSDEVYRAYFGVCGALSVCTLGISIAVLVI